MRSRDRHFDFRKTKPLSWNRSPFFGTLLNSLSLMFPVGEKHFIKAVRSAAAELNDEMLLGDVDVFYRQEAKHSREHNKFNRLMQEEGLDLQRIEANTLARLSKFTNPDAALVATVVLEELTGLLAHLLPLIKDFVLRGDKEVASMWLWHALEEREHVHVARELYKTQNISKITTVVVSILTIKLFVEQLIENYKEVSRVSNL